MSPRALKLLAVLTMLAALAGVVAIAVWSQTSAFLVERGPSVSETVVVLPRGAGLDEITSRLNAAGVIERPWLFRLAVRLRRRRSWCCRAAPGSRASPGCSSRRA